MLTGVGVTDERLDSPSSGMEEELGDVGFEANGEERREGCGGVRPWPSGPPRASAAAARPAG
jgi:hypothetical protein